jgi:hypothetical protein
LRRVFRRACRSVASSFDVLLEGREESDMRFMMIVKADRNYEAGAPPTPELMAAVGKLSEEMIKAGVLLDMGGLLPTSKGALINVKKGKLTVTDGPFSETKEVIGGYAVLQCKSREEAIERGRRFMQLHADVLGPSYEGELEIRQMPDTAPQFQ